MNKKRIRRTWSTLLLLTAMAVTQIPISDVRAQAVASDFQLNGSHLVKYAGTAPQEVSVSGSIKSIGEDAFSSHNELIKVTVEGNVEKIGNRAFADCHSLRTVVIGDSVKEIASGAFSDCPNLVSVTLGAGVSKLGNGVFAGCDELERVTIDGKNTHLLYKNGILSDDQETVIYQMLPGNTIENYEIPATVTRIQGYAFWGNRYVKNVSLGSGLTEIPAYAFSNCVNLEQVLVPYSVRSIGARAFEDCVNLKSINLPESVSKIQETAFDGCPKVEFRTVPGTYGADYAASREVPQGAETAQTETKESKEINVTSPEETPEKEEKPSSPNKEETEDSEKTQKEPEENPQEAETEASQEAEGQPDREGNLLGESSVVSGKVLVFMDTHRVFSGAMPNEETPSGKGTQEPEGDKEADSAAAEDMQTGTTVAVKEGKAVFGSLSGKRDVSPETGDWLHPKWLLAFGLFCSAGGLFFYKGKREEPERFKKRNF